MKRFPDLVICEQCDSVYRRRTLARGEVTRCQTCDAVLYRATPLDLDGWLALTLTAAIVFLIANLCPVIRISLGGLHSEATLWQSALALTHGPSAPIAVPTALAIIIVPGLQIALLGWVLVHARAGRRAPGFENALRWLVLLRPWSMVEVAFLGILVAVVKLTSVVEVVPGPGIWATAALMLLVTLIANRDLHGLWELTDPRRSGPSSEPSSEPPSARPAMRPRTP